MLGTDLARLRRAASAGRAALPRHRRAHRAAARHRLHRQQVRDRVASWTRSRASAASIRSTFRLELLQEHAARRQDRSSAWRRWRTGAASATAARSASPISTIPARRSPASPRSRSTARSGQIKVHNFWCTIDCGVAVQPDNVVAQTESSIVYGLGVALSERITDQGRRGRAVELLRLPRAAHERGAGDAHRGDRRPTTTRPAPARWRRRWSRRRSPTRSRGSPACGCGTRRSRRSG